MSLKLIFIACLLLLNITCSSQKQETIEVKKVSQIMSENKIHLENYYLINKGILESYFKGFTETNSKDSLKLKNIAITENVYFNTYEYIPTDYSKFHSEFFQVNNNIFTIDEIVKENKINLKYYNPYFYLREWYVFSNQNKEKIIVISAQNRTLYNDREVLSFFVIKITTNDIDVKLLYDLEY